MIGHMAGKWGAVAIAAALLVPSFASAAALSSAQVSAIVTLLEAFGANGETVANVRSALGGLVISSVGANSSSSLPADPPLFNPVPTDSLYLGGGIGYDISFNTKAYPVTPFGFAVIGVTRGRAFVENPRLASEFSWSHFSSTVRPTVYMNINAPYGSTVAGNIGSPRSCPGVTAASGAVAAANGEPSACEGYNYGYNAAKHAYAYAAQSNAASPLWWLDVEEANSWSEDIAVNDAAIQGAIDYLNAQGVHVGIYSVRYMWQNIAGADFAPTQTINGRKTPTPTWFPIGIASQVEAINACRTKASFIAGSPVWIIQYEASSTAVDQNIAC